MYVATINVPGYLPMDDDPPVFETAREAWEYLREERVRSEDESDGWNNGSLTTTVSALCAAEHGNAEGVVYGMTPGYDGDHDLGLAYCVTFTNDAQEG